MRPPLATDRISLGFWLNIRFVVNHRGAFRSIITYVIDLLTSEGRYFLWITAVPLPRRCLQSSTTLGIAHAPCYTGAERATQFAARVGSSLFDFLTVPSTHYVPKIVFTFSPICHACKNSIAIYLIIMRDLIFFSLHRPAPSNPPLRLLVGCDSNGRQRRLPEPALWLPNDLSIPRAPENMSHKIS